MYIFAQPWDTVNAHGVARASFLCTTDTSWLLVSKLLESFGYFAAGISWLPFYIPMKMIIWRAGGDL